MRACRPRVSSPAVGDGRGGRVADLVLVGVLLRVQRDRRVNLGRVVVSSSLEDLRQEKVEVEPRVSCGS